MLSTIVLKKHYTQEKLANLINTSPKYISRLELGQHNPSLDMVERIATALNVEPDKLFSKVGKISLPDRVNMLTKL